jgi:hypothetical protein
MTARPAPSQIGAAAPNAAELLRSPELATLLRWLRERPVQTDGAISVRLAEIQLAFDRSERTVRRWIASLVEKSFLSSVHIEAGLVEAICAPASVSAQTPAHVSAHMSAPVPTQTPDPEVVALEEILRQRKTEDRAEVAQSGPQTAIAKVGDLARRVLERSHVQVSKSKDVQNVHERRNVEICTHQGRSDPPCSDRREQFEFECRELDRQLGGHNTHPWTTFSFVLAFMDGPLTEAQYRAIVESAKREHRRRAVAYGALKRQLSACGRTKCEKAGLWNDKKGEPQLHRFRDLKERLAAMGIAWRDEWSRRARAPPAS